MDGETLGRAIKSDVDLRKTALVMLTSGAQVGDVSHLERVGFAAYLMKPVRRMDLLDALAIVRAAAANPDAPVVMITRHRLTEFRTSEKHQKTDLRAALTARILVAEDNAVNQKLTVRLLEKLGCQVDIACNGREALEMWDKLPYDAILMDCQMPEMDGYEATAEIRKRESGPPGPAQHRIPILALTASAMEEDVKRCLAAGMDDFVSKPVRIDDLRRVVERWAQPRPQETRSLT
jgi:CheY-like chemotaxis protein